MTQKIRSEINILLFQSLSIFTKTDLKFSLHDFLFFHSTDRINTTVVYLPNKNMQYDKYEIKIQMKLMCLVMHRKHSCCDKV